MSSSDDDICVAGAEADETDDVVVSGVAEPGVARRGRAKLSLAGVLLCYIVCDVSLPLSFLMTERLVLHTWTLARCQRRLSSLVSRNALGSLAKTRPILKAMRLVCGRIVDGRTMTPLVL